MTVAVGDFLAQSQVSLGDGFMIVSVYSALLGSTLDTSFVRQSTEYSIFFTWIGELWFLRSILDLLFVTHFRFVSVFCVVLGSTADTCSASVYGVFHIRELVDYGS